MSTYTSNNMYQVWWSESVTPEFTQEQRDTYRDFKISQFYPIGNIVNNKRLFRALFTDKQQIDDTMNFILSTGKTVTICDVRDKDGIRYGQERVVIGYDTDDNPIYQIIDSVDDLGDVVIKYPINIAEYNQFMQDIPALDEQGNSILVTPAGNTVSGYASWENRL